MINFVKALGLLLSALILSTAQAQDIIVSNDQQAPFSAYGNSGVGQSFTSPIDGKMTAVSVRKFFGGSTATLYVFANADASGSPIYSQSGINLIPTSYNSPQQVVNLTSAVPISAGQAYSFVFVSPGGMTLYSNNADDYSGGTLLYFDGANYGFSAARDIDFAIYAQSLTNEPAPPRMIPSISAWGLLLIVLTIAVATLMLTSKLRR